MLAGWRNIGKIVLEPLHPCLMKRNTFRFRRENEAIKKINAGEGDRDPCRHSEISSSVWKSKAGSVCLSVCLSGHPCPVPLVDIFTAVHVHCPEGETEAWSDVLVVRNLVPMALGKEVHNVSFS